MKSQKEEEREEQLAQKYWEGWDAGYLYAVRLLRDWFIKREKE